MAEVRMLLGRKTYGIFKPGYPPSFLDSGFTGGHIRAQNTMRRRASTVKETAVLAQGVSKQSLLPTTTQEHELYFKTYFYGDVCGRQMFLKRSKTYFEDVDICIDFNTLTREPSATRNICFGHEKPNRVNIWSMGHSGRIHSQICRTRRDQIRILCTLRTGGRGHAGPPLFRRCFSSNGSYDTPLYKNKSAYYEILQVSPTATQAQIKTAYYKQSFIYHPDKNAGSEEATNRFAEISEAYNVLGNKSLRKKYDRGILTNTDLLGARKPTAKDSGSSAGQQTRSRSSSIAGVNSQKMFDFDSFIKSHYGEQLQRERDHRLRQELRKRIKEETLDQKKFVGGAEIGIAVLIAMAIALFLSVRSAK